MSLENHLNHPGRLAALKAVALLDTPAEAAFDRLSRLAARFTRSPVALVSLVDRDRQFFKSAVGLPDPWRTLRETPLSHSFCQYNRILGTPLVLSDARQHPLFCKNLAIRDLNVIAYMGFPLTTADNHILGSFCVIDGQPRNWTAAEIETLEDLTASVMTEISLRAEIRQRRKAEAEAEKLWETVRNSPLSILITDPGGRIEYTNPAFSRTTGFDAQDVIGQPLGHLGSDGPDSQDPVWRTVTSGRAWQGEVSGWKKDGAMAWEQALYLPVKDRSGRVTNVVIMKEDITAKKETERIKEDVDRIMRHDLKQPLTAVITMPQLLVRRGGLSPEQSRMIKAIEENGIRMLDMIDLALDMFKIETGDYRFMPDRVDVVRVIRLADSHLAPIKDRKGVGIRLSLNHAPLGEGGLMVLSEERLLFPIFSNLLANAVEASPQGGDILIRILAKEGVTVAIQNQGGVPLPVRDLFFDKYATHGKKNGTGLGTYSAKLFAGVMGYGLRMETDDKKNTTTLTLEIPGDSFPAP